MRGPSACAGYWNDRVHTLATFHGKAFVVRKDPTAASAALIDGLHVKDRLAPFKYPRWVELVAELPKTATGKIPRFKLRER